MAIRATRALSANQPATQLGFDFSARRAPEPAPAHAHGTAPAGDAARVSSPSRTTRPHAPAEQPAVAQMVQVAEPTAEPLDLAALLEKTLRARVSTPLRLTVTDNRRTMLSLRRRDVLVEVRLHHMFLRGDARIWDALGDYLFQADRSAGVLIARYIEQHRKQIRRPQRRPLALATAGTHHDLGEIFRAVNARYFDNAVEAHITWGRDGAGPLRATRRSIKLGSYTSRDRLIRVHPALDAAFVPRFFVEYIVYHEMLHHVLPPTLQHGRRELHGAEFKAREQEFQDFHAALAWEQDNLRRLLRNRKTRAPRKPRP